MCLHLHCIINLDISYCVFTILLSICFGKSTKKLLKVLAIFLWLVISFPLLLMLCIFGGVVLLILIISLIPCHTLFSFFIVFFRKVYIMVCFTLFSNFVLGIFINFKEFKQFFSFSSIFGFDIFSTYFIFWSIDFKIPVVIQGFFKVLISLFESFLRGVCCRKRLFNSTENR